MVPYISVLFLLLSAALGKCGAQKSAGTIQAGGLQIYYEQTGKGDAIVLLHAGLQNHAMWAEQVQVLSKKYTVITPDLPYHGSSSGHDTTLLAQDVIRILLDSLQVQKASVAGLSMGASVAQDFVIAYPERVHKAFFISAGINGFEKQHPIDSISMQWYSQFAAALERKDTAKAAMEFTKAWGEGVHHKGDSLTKSASRYVYQTTLTTLRQHKMAGWPRLQVTPPAIEGIAGIKVPVLIIHGNQDLPYVDVASKYLEQKIAGAKRVLLNGVAHMLNMEKPAEVTKLMMDFLKEK